MPSSRENAPKQPQPADDEIARTARKMADTLGGEEPQREWHESRPGDPPAIGQRKETAGDPDTADPHEEALHAALRELQARCDSHPDSQRLALPAGSDVDLLHTTNAMWGQVIAERTQTGNEALFHRNGEPVSVARHRTSDGQVHEIRAHTQATMRGLSAAVVFWHGKRESRTLAAGGNEPLKGEDLEQVVESVNRTPGRGHGRVLYSPPRAKATGSPGRPESWHIRYPPPRLPQQSVTEMLMSPPDGALPPLDRVCDFPILVNGGGYRLVTDAGYCAEAAVYITEGAAVDLDSLPGPEEAIARLTGPEAGLFRGFPFDSEASVAHLYALLLAPVIGPVCGAKPAFLGDKAQPRTGASKLIRTAAILVTGRDPVMLAAQSKGRESEESMEKNLMTTGLSGVPFVMMDNATGILDSRTWNAYATSTVWSGRLLGGNKTGYVHRRSLVDTVTANNLAFTVESAGRLCPIRLDAGVPEPETRRFDFDCEVEAAGNRGFYLAGVLSLVKQWLDADRPPGPEVRAWGGFERWRDTTSGILAAAGIAGFGDDTAAPMVARVEDDGMAAFIQWWWDTHREKPVLTSAMAVPAVLGTDDQEGILSLDGPPASAMKKLGWKIKGASGKRFRLEEGTVVAVTPAGRDAHKKKALWALRPDDR